MNLKFKSIIINTVKFEISQQGSMKKTLTKNKSGLKKYFLSKPAPLPLQLKLNTQTVLYEESCTQFFQNFHHNFDIVTKQEKFRDREKGKNKQVKKKNLRRNQKQMKLKQIDPNRCPSNFKKRSQYSQSSRYIKNGTQSKISRSSSTRPSSGRSSSFWH